MMLNRVGADQLRYNPLKKTLHRYCEGAIIMLSRLARDLYEKISEHNIIGAQEHLPPEDEYLSKYYSSLNMFAGGYILQNLESVGVDAIFKNRLRENGFRPAETWWLQIKPNWKQVEYTSCSRPVSSFPIL